jgi:O-acetyl-ADP-ribose deacetylase (regulator of RNase III)
MVQRLQITQGDITRQKVDAIVNAANQSLSGGGGVDGAIHRAAGPGLSEACRAIGGCPTGQARITPGFNLPAEYVIHTVGPMWQGGNHGEAELLASCYQQSLLLAREHNLCRIAFPAISTGVYGYPLHEAAKVAVQVVQTFLAEDSKFESVILVCYDNAAYQAFHRAANLPGQDQVSA